MYSIETLIRVRYAETDQMGYVYYGVYAQYYEVGRVELLRSLGISYKQLEDQGILLPVVDLNVNYKKPAFYDDQLKVRTTIKKIPTVKISFEYKIFDVNNQLLNSAEVILAFVNAETGKICQAPKNLVDLIRRKLV